MLVWLQPESTRICSFLSIQLLWGHIWRTVSGLGLPSAGKDLAHWSKSSRSLWDGERLEHMRYRWKLRQIHLFSLKKRRFGKRPLHCLQLTWSEDRTRFILVVHSNRLRGKVLKREHGELLLDTMKIRWWLPNTGKDLTGRGPVQPDVTCPCWAWGRTRWPLEFLPT